MTKAITPEGHDALVQAMKNCREKALEKYGPDFYAQIGMYANTRRTELARRGEIVVGRLKGSKVVNGKVVQPWEVSPR